MKINFEKILLFLIAFFLPLSIIQVHRVSAAMILLVFFMIFSMIKKNFKFIYKFDNVNSMFIFFLFLSLCTFCVCVNSNIGTNWKKVGAFNEILFLLIIMFKLVCSENVVNNHLKTFIRGLKYGCILNFIWCYIQILLYKVAAIDVNDFIFNRCLHFVETASAYRDGSIYCVTGLGWHPAQLVPIIVFSLCIFNNYIMKILILGVCILSHNSTCMMAALIYFSLDTLFVFKNFTSIKLRKKKVYANVILILAVVIVCAFQRELVAIIYSSVTKIFYRIRNALGKSNEADISTYLHMRYYLFYPSILNKTTIWQNIFGYGYECSGYPFSKYLDQYILLKDWVVESDIINFLLGRGILWTCFFYAWLVKLMKKGYKISKYYVIFIGILIILGIMYNNQFWWVFIVEVVISEAIYHKKNIWNYDKDNINY